MQHKNLIKKKEKIISKLIKYLIKNKQWILFKRTTKRIFLYQNYN